jgi:sugar lactone lactonase YvrE
MKKRSLFISLCLFIVISAILPGRTVRAEEVDAYVPYVTYCYDSHANGDWYVSPHAYVPEKDTDSVDMGLEVKLKDPSDLTCDKDGNLYIADTGNNRIVILDSELKVKNIISEYTDNSGETTGFNQPKAVFVNEQGDIYVGDTLNCRIVKYDKEGKLLQVIDSPSEEVLQKVIFEPSAIAVDNYDRIYVISQSTNMGVLTLDSEGVFQGFIGAEKTTGTFWDIVKDAFMSEEKKAKARQNVPTEYNNISIDDKGFLYVTSSAYDQSAQYNSMVNKSGTANPIKKLNPSGADVLKRNGPFNQGGDINYFYDCSRFIDVALGTDNVYSLLDQTGGKIFTYDGDGNLLYVFGGLGSSLGVFHMPVAITYYGDKILVLDARTASITSFIRTKYGNTIAEAIRLQNARKYTDAAEEWKNVLKENNTFEQAYRGIATSHMRLGDYKAAMENFRYGSDLEGYSEAYSSYRKGVMEHYMLLIPVVIALIVFLVGLASKKMKAVNEAGWNKQGPVTLKEELCYGWYVIFHPFDGFYELKRSRKGTVRGATIFLVLAVLEELFKQIGSGYIVTGRDWARVSIVDAFMSIGALVLLWTLANWGLTTLMDGKGKLKDIYIASCYALIPTILIGFPATILTNFCSSAELGFINIFCTAGYIWTLLLIFFGALVVNDYSLLKNIVTTAFSIIGMACIAFVSILTVNLFVSLFGFVQTITNEIVYRI